MEPNNYIMYFYPRPPRGGRPVAGRLDQPFFCISIHAPREEGDYAGLDYDPIIDIISIHAPREEGDKAV